jgi:hypothetical protein
MNNGLGERGKEQGENYELRIRNYELKGGSTINLSTAQR